MENHLRKPGIIAFVPTLYMKDLAIAIDFYKKAFNAIELHSVMHEGRVHVAELYIGEALFRLHEEVISARELEPLTLKGTSVVIGLFVADPHSVQKQAIAAGAEERSPVTDYDYGYRQGTIRDPFGHHWMIEQDTPIGEWKMD